MVCKDYNGWRKERILHGSIALFVLSNFRRGLSSEVNNGQYAA